MTGLQINHRTTYVYRQPVGLGPHRLMLRPRESRDVKLVSTELAITPRPRLTWANDVFGNVVATASFVEPASILTIESRVKLDHSSEAWPIFDIAASAISYPFTYTEDERLDLGALLIPQYHDPERRLAMWARGFVLGDVTDTLSMLKDLNAEIPSWVCYESRDEEGTQAPLDTLARGWGSCRDLAVLLIEAARCLGLGARIVSGYLFSPGETGTVLIGSGQTGSTHAWAEIYLPGAGWIAYDPTNRTVGGSSLVPVAVARDVRQVVPVSGSFIGMPNDFLSLSVAVSIYGM
jgi:transglutaminase-like putative cysteine protease